MNQAERRRFLIEALIDENPQLVAARQAGEPCTPADADGQRGLLRSLMNVRPPRPLAPEVTRIQDEYLLARLTERGGAVDAATLPPVSADDPAISLWRGDITTLAADAIVNAANSQALGCFVPCHHCIDNSIHTFAGMQLREACEQELARRHAAGLGRELATGDAFITGGFNLPACHVIHTVGPIVHGVSPTARNRDELARCYRSCLELATSCGLSSIAFCCISTGEFRFPAREAAEIAIATVRNFIESSPSPLKVVFNVFTESDERIYRELLG